MVAGSRQIFIADEQLFTMSPVWLVGWIAPWYTSMSNTAGNNEIRFFRIRRYN
jgi:hypothetical protein